MLLQQVSEVALYALRHLVWWKVVVGDLASEGRHVPGDVPSEQEGEAVGSDGTVANTEDLVGEVAQYALGLVGRVERCTAVSGHDDAVGRCNRYGQCHWSKPIRTK